MLKNKESVINIPLFRNTVINIQINFLTYNLQVVITAQLKYCYRILSNLFNVKIKMLFQHRPLGLTVQTGFSMSVRCNSKTQIQIPSPTSADYASRSFFSFRWNSKSSDDSAVCSLPRKAREDRSIRLH